MGPVLSLPGPTPQCPKLLLLACASLSSPSTRDFDFWCAGGVIGGMEACPWNFQLAAATLLSKFIKDYACTFN
ncbi:hypothetical protein AAC387_Pa03g3476 [Persea americana]